MHQLLDLDCVPVRAFDILAETHLQGTVGNNNVLKSNNIVSTNCSLINNRDSLLNIASINNYAANLTVEGCRSEATTSGIRCVSNNLNGVCTIVKSFNSLIENLTVCCGVLKILLLLIAVATYVANSTLPTSLINLFSYIGRLEWRNNLLYESNLSNSHVLVLQSNLLSSSQLSDHLLSENDINIFHLWHDVSQ